ncbi:TonB-dependent receptor [Sphingomonas cannabina]|uniref:TonB-dependent receptor n=1 Tax=Sphingomonas cannabina TaxID=2899123 RepID=UPI001F1C1D8C|nr:TonB-dependent receptor [Sphingomonas cannabina]UIJ44797.1 TonB-dependent receptor [Sphingomonas cannabina]
MRFSSSLSRSSWGAAVALAAAASSPVCAQEQARYRFDLPAQSLGAALRDVTIITRRNIVAAAHATDGRRAPAVRGTYTVEEALALLLDRTGLRADTVGDALVIRPDARDGALPPPADPAQHDGEIVITGSRIRGARIASPVISVSQDQIRDAGQATLGDVVRSIPQSFGGGQNPGIGFNVPAISGVNVGGGASINLRGLGSDATLTLLNGRRLSYSGSRQSIDVSTIPVGALDRIEIVADGASALYGSDAVGGVANIILKRDLDGLETRARLGASTDGGNVQQQYGATGGLRWGSGGVIAAYEFNRNTAVDSADRDYAATRSRGLTLYPSMRNHNALLSAHQHLASTLEVSVDALFNERRQAFTYAMNPAGDLRVSRATQSTDSRAFAIAPSLQFEPGGGWNVVLTGSYAEDRTDFRVDAVIGGGALELGAGCYCNSARWVELSGDGPLFDLPGGPAKLALGVGYRNIELESDRGPGNPLNFIRSQSNRYAYGELSLPLIGPALGIPGLYRLDLTAAARHERYERAGSVTTPKVGIVYAPSPSLDLKASWGRSFRAPTLYQRYLPPALTLLPARNVGAAGAPAGASALLIEGGRPDLAPERATSWSVTAGVHPPTLAGFTAELSYFETRYIDRIVAPIAFVSQALADPAYAAQVTRSPSPEMLAAILASGAYFVNGTGAPYDPANVIAFIDNSNLNAGRQWARGVDLLATYRSRLGRSDDEIAVSANASYLSSRRRISADQAARPLAGILFNPPHWRGRATASWRHDRFSLTAIANYTGRLQDTRFSPATVVPDQVRFDFTLRYRSGDTGPAWLRGLDVTLGVENAFGAEPPPIFISSVTDTPYDSTNYTPFGRVISLAIAKSW